MTSHIRLLQTMREVLREAGIAEVPAAGQFSLPSTSPTLFPGAIYGFAAQLTDQERANLFKEAKTRKSNRIQCLNDYQAIEGNLYPLYWGKDKHLGARPHQHLQNPTKTGAIRLATYKSLEGKTIACVSLTVVNFEAAERAMQNKFPDLLKTTTKKFGSND